MNTANEDKTKNRPIVQRRPDRRVSDIHWCVAVLCVQWVCMVVLLVIILHLSAKNDRLLSEVDKYGMKQFSCWQLLQNADVRRIMCAK